MMTESVKGGDPGRVRSRIRAVIDLINSGTGDITEDDDMQRALLATVREFPARVKCASLAWHTLHAAIQGQTEPVSTEGPGAPGSSLLD